MPTLFHDVIFGPIHSRRLGYSLGINLLPVNSKICSFNCIYCECGWNPTDKNFPSFVNREVVNSELESRLKSIKLQNESLDVLTFAGNGEPTLHPEFLQIVEDVISLRNVYFPKVKIAVLSNSTTLGNKNVKDALTKVDLPILKLDSVIEKTFYLINNPPKTFDFKTYILNLTNFNNKIIVQTLFLRGVMGNDIIDNTTEFEVDELIKVLKKIKPESVMIYSLDRATPANGLVKISSSELKEIAEKMEKSNLSVQVTI